MDSEDVKKGYQPALRQFPPLELAIETERSGGRKENTDKAE